MALIVLKTGSLFNETLIVNDLGGLVIQGNNLILELSKMYSLDEIRNSEDLYNYLSIHGGKGDSTFWIEDYSKSDVYPFIIDNHTKLKKLGIGLEFNPAVFDFEPDGTLRLTKNLMEIAEPQTQIGQILFVGDDGFGNPEIKIGYPAEQTFVQPYSNKLQSISDLNLNSNQLLYATDSENFSAISLSNDVFDLLNAADKSAIRNLLGVYSSPEVDFKFDELNWKKPVRLVSVDNIDLVSTSFSGVIDGVAVSNGDRILLVGQTDATQNGIYVATDALNPSTWVRSNDASSSQELTGCVVNVLEGSVNKGKIYVLTGSDVVLGTSELLFQEIGGGTVLSDGATDGSVLFWDAANSQWTSSDLFKFDNNNKSFQAYLVNTGTQTVLDGLFLSAQMGVDAFHDVVRSADRDTGRVKLIENSVTIDSVTEKGSERDSAALVLKTESDGLKSANLELKRLFDVNGELKERISLIKQVSDDFDTVVDFPFSSANEADRILLQNTGMVFTNYDSTLSYTEKGVTVNNEVSHMVFDIQGLKLSRSLKVGIFNEQFFTPFEGAIQYDGFNLLMYKNNRWVGLDSPRTMMVQAVSANQPTSDMYLKMNGEFTNELPFIVPFDCYLNSLLIQFVANATINDKPDIVIEVLKLDGTTQTITLNIPNSSAMIYKKDYGMTHLLNTGDRVAFKFQNLSLGEGVFEFINVSVVLTEAGYFYEDTGESIVQILDAPLSLF